MVSLRPVRRWLDRVGASPGRALVALTLVALTLRLVGLGMRSFHWDEARVGYWTLRYLETGTFAYRPIIHGPFLPIVNRHVFALLGASDATARLVVALLGGVLPLAAWLFRDYLDDAEVVALGGFLAFNPLLLYFSRFMRADVPLAVFATFALGFTVRALASGRRRHLLAAGVALGLALTTKENVLVYLACWGGALGVAYGLRVLPRYRSDSQASTVRTLGTVGRDAATAAGDALRPLLAAVVPALLLTLLVVVYFYAPRGAAGEPSLSAALSTPTLLPALVEQATLGSVETFRAGIWASPEVREHPYLPFLAHYAGVLAIGGAVLYTLAALGTAVTLRVRERAPRPLVVFAAAWGFVSVLGYPIAADIMAPWLAVHAAVPLAIPAAVGLVAVARWTRGRLAFDGTDGTSERNAARDRALAAGVVLALLVLSAQTGVVVLATSYTSPTPRVNLLAQGAQSGDDLDPLVADLEAAAGTEPAVLYYGERFYLPNETVADEPPGPDDRWLGWWLGRLPLSWYVERADLSTAYAPDAAALSDRADDGPLPPVVVADVAVADDVAPAVSGYERTRYDLYLYGGTVVVFTDESRLKSPERAAVSGRVTAQSLRRC
ncbi:TIGR03663 family protein [Halogranum gelatinilyticum]|uniref:TIGR03663 family protein n=1 Tax=Halogranum gelatinilyticum TaxID=660521 RepID=A0A1G9XTJ2_9EURY|nr:flippase activity-associated protein Agl23 [Halogranum gelatinilyticum]SDN00142.1 TIGR03663 family protein [Halogranum gelatinilyticum]